MAAKHNNAGVQRVLAGDTGFLDSLTPRAPSGASGRAKPSEKPADSAAAPVPTEPATPVRATAAAAAAAAATTAATAATPVASMPTPQPPATAEDLKFQRLQEATQEAIQGMRQRVASIRAGLGSLSDAEVAMLLQQVRAATAALQPEEDAGS